jgi:hypothetical protein
MYATVLTQLPFLSDVALFVSFGEPILKVSLNSPQYVLEILDHKTSYKAISSSLLLPPTFVLHKILFPKRITLYILWHDSKTSQNQNMTDYI